ncbi:MAG: aryl-sulfate sulfotransferase [Lentisphaeria bacterium]|nr:aryl-sulfate sulfotransferase [Lentisphaeria bacterium]
MPASIQTVGTTVYNREHCYAGVTAILVKGDRGPDVGLITMEGKIVKRWPMDDPARKGGVPRARLQPDGRLLVLRSAKGWGGCVQEYAWDGTRIWEYAPPPELMLHHDVEKTAAGNVLIVAREEVPLEVRGRAREPERREMLYADVIQEVTPDGNVAWEWHQHEHLDIHLCCKVPAPVDWWAGSSNNTLVDWTHTNTVQALPENRWFDAGDTRFRPGNILMSLRQLDLVLIVDRETGTIVWTYTGDYLGGLSGQHDSHMIEKGLPGEGNILIFDNGASPTTNLAHCGCSFVLEVDPVAAATVWVYDQRETFHSNFTSSCQRLPNGNTLVLEAAHRRLFEVTRERNLVWEHVFAQPPFIQRAYRYGWDFCPQLREVRE